LPDTTRPTDREAVIRAFLAAHGWDRAERAPLAGDASFRRYERLRRGDEGVLLMDAPPPKEDVRPFARLARHLGTLGLSAPAILAEDGAAGLLLIEDFGDATFTRILAEGGDERALYEIAVDILVHLHRLAPEAAVPAGLRAYDDETLLAEAFLLTDWYMPRVMGRQTPTAVRHAYGQAWMEAFAVVRAQPRTLVLRDYHVDNLMVLEGRPGVAACGLLDFQDALAGPAAYDLMSLLEDARRDIDPALADAIRRRYVAAFPDLDRPAFDAAFAVLAAQRHAKVIGIFTRLCLRDGKPRYLGHIPRLWRLLERALDHPNLAPVADWFTRNIPSERREKPSCPPVAA
jgi:hypothetical protein